MEVYFFFTLSEFGWCCGKSLTLIFYWLCWRTSPPILLSLGDSDCTCLCPLRSPQVELLFDATGPQTPTSQTSCCFFFLQPCDPQVPDSTAGLCTAACTYAALFFRSITEAHCGREDGNFQKRRSSGGEKRWKRCTNKRSEPEIRCQTER